MRIINVSLLALALGGATFAADPPATLPASTEPAPVLDLPAQLTVEVGRKCVLTAQTSAKKVTWQLPSGVDGLPLDGKRLAVWASPGSYVIRAAVPSGEDVVWAELVLTVTGGHSPVLPDGVLGLVKASREGAAKVPLPIRQSGATALAKAQRGIASAIAAGGLSKPADILAAWRGANNAAVSPADWKPWGEAASAALAKLYADGKLPDGKAWVAAMNELAEGLE